MKVLQKTAKLFKFTFRSDIFNSGSTCLSVRICINTHQKEMFQIKVSDENETYFMFGAYNNSNPVALV
jgi:hypothetical protein